MTLPAEFHAFSPLHALAAGTCGAIVAALCIAGRAQLPRGREPHVRRVWIVGLLVIQSANVLYYLPPSRFDLAVSFPLQLCDLAGWVALLALHTQRRWLRTTLFYWGFGLCTQAFFTPTLSNGPDHPKFWLFWATHAQIVGSALYDAVVLAYRPKWRDFLVASLVLFAYGAIVIPLDIIWGWNYGYMGRSAPSKPTIVDSLGSWPLRILWIGLIAHGVFFALTLAFNFPFARRANHRGSQS